MTYNISNSYSCKEISNEYSYETKIYLVELKKIYNNSTFINLSPNEIEIIYNNFNLDKEKNKAIIVIDYFESKDSRMATSDFDYHIFLENGNELNLSNLD